MTTNTATQANTENTDINVRISENVSLVENKGFWSIEHIQAVDKKHHLAKNDTRTTIEHCGDLNNCILSLRKHIGSSITSEQYQTLYHAYRDVLKMFKTTTDGDDYEFSNIIRWTVKQRDMTHTVTTNSNHFGFFLEYTKETKHRKSDGHVHDVFTANSHRNAAMTLLNKTLSSELTNETLEEFIEKMTTYAEHINTSMTDYEKL